MVNESCMSPCSNFWRIYLSAMFIFLHISIARAAKEAYFRSDQGVASEPGELPQQLDAEKTQAWRVPIEQGHSTPLLINERLILTTWKADSKELATLAIDAKTGKTIWRKALSPQQVEQTHEIGSPATASVATDGERLFVFFGSAGMYCYDLQGKLLWQNPMGPFRDEYGAGSSPIVFNGKVILNQDHDIDSFLVAMDAGTGKIIWKTPRPDAVRSYATPVIWKNSQGRPEILVAGALQLAAYEPEHGQRLWWVNGLARIVIPTPVFDGPIIYMPSWAPGGDTSKRIKFDTWPDALAKWDANHDGKLSKSEIDNRDVLDRFFRMDLDQDGALDQKEWERQAAFFTHARNSILALKPSGSDELPDTAVLWRHDRGVPYVSSPVLYHSILWLVKDGGIVTKLDPKDGRLLQEERVPGIGNYFASPVAGDNKVFFASQSGTVSIMSAENEWKVLGSRDFHEKIFATPVLNKGRVFIRSDQALYCFQKNAHGSPKE
jgi:outer membrane protein assembly factor BamB